MPSKCPWRVSCAGVADNAIGQYRDAARREAQQKLRELAVHNVHTGLAADRFRMITPDGAEPWMPIVQQEQGAGT